MRTLINLVESKLLSELTVPKNYTSASVLLMQAGYRSLGYGAYGGVFQKPGANYVLKIFRNCDRAYMDFVKLAVANPNPHFPKFYGKLVRINSKYSAIRMECLDFVVKNDWRRIKTYLVLDDDDGADIDRDMLIACDLIKEYLLPKYTIDIKGSNVMYRGLTPVITDPVSMSSLTPDEMMDLCESDDDNDSLDNLPSSAAIKALIPEFVKATQAQYDKWQIIDDDDIGFQDEYAGGGICHLIADDLCSIMNSHGIYCATVSSTHEQHVYCVAQCSDGVFEVDVPYRNYETGGGFSWQRIDGITFDADYISIYRLDIDPAAFKNYVDEW